MNQGKNNFVNAPGLILQLITSIVMNNKGIIIAVVGLFYALQNYATPGMVDLGADLLKNIGSKEYIAKFAECATTKNTFDPGEIKKCIHDDKEIIKVVKE